MASGWVIATVPFGERNRRALVLVEDLERDAPHARTLDLEEEIGQVRPTPHGLLVMGAHARLIAAAESGDGLELLADLGVHECTSELEIIGDEALCTTLHGRMQRIALKP